MNETGQDAHAVSPGKGSDMALGNGSPRGARGHGTSARRRAGRSTTPVFVAVAAVVAAGGVTVTLLAASGGGAPSALAAVAGALAKTSAESYGFSLHSTVEFRKRLMSSDTVSGTIDPGRELGMELLTATAGQRPARAEIRFIGRYEYTRVSPTSGLRGIGKSWDKAPVPPAGTNEMPGSYGFVSDQPVSPGELSEVLQSAATVRDVGPASGTGWTGNKYAFTASLSGGHGSVSGTVYIDRQGHVRRLATTTAQGTVTTDRDLTFDDYGGPVPVTAPPASQEVYTSMPNWGLYF